MLISSLPPRAYNSTKTSAETREHHSQRHVPDETVRAPAAHRTLPGKKLELPIKRVMQGTPLTEVAGAEATDHSRRCGWCVQIGERRLAWHRQTSLRGAHAVAGRALDAPAVVLKDTSGSRQASTNAPARIPAAATKTGCRASVRACA
jgi:hypothetical protein